MLDLLSTSSLLLIFSEIDGGEALLSDYLLFSVGDASITSFIFASSLSSLRGRGFTIDNC